MAVIATITISGTAHSVYAITDATSALSDAIAYHNARLGASSWSDASSADKQKAIVTAARMIDRAVWSGTKTVPSQANAFPRDNATCRGTPVTSGTTPDDIANGQFELALALLEDESVQDKRNTRTDIKRAKAGSAEVEYFKPNAGEETKFPTVVQQLIGCYLASASTDLQVPYAGGIVDSDFTATDFDVTEGFS